MDSKEKFEWAVDFILEHEGGYVNNPKDPGGETKYGISKRSYPREDIRHLTKERAKEIYYDDWWTKYHYDRIFDKYIGRKVFDMSVNMGGRRAHKILQEAVNIVGNKRISVDGIIGPNTLREVNACDPEKLLDGIRTVQKGFYLRLIRKRPRLAVFKNGWIRRAMA